MKENETYEVLRWGITLRELYEHWDNLSINRKVAWKWMTFPDSLKKRRPDIPQEYIVQWMKEHQDKY